MGKKDNSPRDNARPTGDMSAEESHEYAREFQKENFGAASNVGGGRSEGSNASATTQETMQRSNSVADKSADEDRTEHPDEEID